MVLKYSRQRRHVVLERRDRLINQPDESRIVRRKKGDADGFLEELGGSFVCTIRRWNLYRFQ